MNTEANQTENQEHDGKIDVQIILAETPWERKPELGRMETDADKQEVLENKRVSPANLMQDQQDAFKYNQEQLDNIPPDQMSGTIKLKYVVRKKEA